MVTQYLSSISGKVQEYSTLPIHAEVGTHLGHASTRGVPNHEGEGQPHPEDDFL